MRSSHKQWGGLLLPMPHSRGGSVPKQRRNGIAFVLHFNWKLSDCAIAAFPPCIKRQKDTKEKRNQGRRWLLELYNKRGCAGSYHLFLTSSQDSRCGIIVFHSYCFRWPEWRWSIKCIINPPRWLEQLYYFVHLLFLSPSVPSTCWNTKHLNFPLSHWTLV